MCHQPNMQIQTGPSMCVGGEDGVVPASALDQDAEYIESTIKAARKLSFEQDESPKPKTMLSPMKVPRAN